MTAKPTLGYASRTEAVLALRRAGNSSQEIADAIGISTATVTALEHSAGRKKSRRPDRPAEVHGRTVLFPIDLLDELAPEATRRNMHVNMLVRRLIECIVDDSLVTSVLDDADTLDRDEAA